MAMTQLWLVLSGNFAWLNWTTIVLTAAAFDDAQLAHLLPLHVPALASLEWHDGLVVAITVLIVALSWRPARNLFSRNQMMNASFDPLRLVNTYGAFGSVGRERYEVVIEGTRDERLTPGTVWSEYRKWNRLGASRKRTRARYLGAGNRPCSPSSGLNCSSATRKAIKYTHPRPRCRISRAIQ